MIEEHDASIMLTGKHCRPKQSRLNLESGLLQEADTICVQRIAPRCRNAASSYCPFVRSLLPAPLEIEEVVENVVQVDADPHAKVDCKVLVTRVCD